MKPKIFLLTNLIFFSTFFILISSENSIIDENQTRRDIGRMINYIHSLTSSDKVLTKDIKVISNFLTSNSGVQWLQKNYMKSHAERTSMKDLLDEMRQFAFTIKDKELCDACIAIHKHIQSKIGYDNLEEHRKKIIHEIEKKSGFVRRKKRHDQIDTGKLIKVTTEMLNFASLLTHQLQEVVEAIRKLYLVQPSEWLKQHEPSQVYNPDPFFKNKAYISPSHLRAVDKSLSEKLKAHRSLVNNRASASAVSKASSEITGSSSFLVEPRILKDSSTEAPVKESANVTVSNATKSSTQPPMISSGVTTEISTKSNETESESTNPTNQENGEKKIKSDSSSAETQKDASPDQSDDVSMENLENVAARMLEIF